MSTHEQDEVTRRNLANARRRLEKFDERMRARRQQSAEAHGFSDYKEYEALQMQRAQESTDRFTASIEEKCKRRGKTTQQYWAEHPQCPAVENWPECNCDGHIIPFFCPQRLLPYQSMNEEDPLWPLQYTHPPKLEQLSMDQGDISRRLPDKVLECLWVMESQKMPLELPQWTARDPVVKRMATLAAEHSSSPLSCSPRPSFSIPSESTTPPTRVTSEQSSISQTHPEGKPHAAAQQLPEPTLQSSRKVPAQTLRKSQQQRHRKKADTSRLPKPSWSKERIHQSKSRIQKRSTHSMRTRSQGAPVSYAL